MLRCVEVLGSMLVTRRIAAPDVTTGHTEPEVNPRIAHLETLGTAAGVRSYVSNLVCVRAGFHGLVRSFLE